MGEVRFEKGSKEFCFFREFWDLVQKYYIPEDKDEYWESLDKDANVLANKYDDKFFDGLIIAFVTAMSNKLYEGKRRNGKQTEYNRGRQQGLEMSCRLLSAAGDDYGVKIIQEELHRRGRLGISTAATTKELEEAALNGLITLETFLNEYKRLTQTGGDKDD